MQDFRCTCKKIIFQIEDDRIIIKCRHCKRYIHIRTKGLIDVEFRLDQEIQPIPLAKA
ncbi:MAG TPA: hypothetical protein GX711_05545 [Clostridia bacterium]|nr:hypothetical protein [Clostridia bacterium]